MSFSTIKIGLPMAINVIKLMPLRHCAEAELHVILDSVRSTMDSKLPGSLFIHSEVKWIIKLCFLLFSF